MLTFHTLSCVCMYLCVYACVFVLTCRAYPIEEYPCQCRQAAAIMHMMMNNLDPAVAQVSWDKLSAYYLILVTDVLMRCSLVAVVTANHLT